jgi:hypothetical protein
MSWQKELAVDLLPLGLTIAGGKLKDKDPNETGADDAVGNMLIALSPIVPDLLHGTGNGNATLKAMRVIEQAAHSYRVQVGDVQNG